MTLLTGINQILLFIVLIMAATALGWHLWEKFKSMFSISVKSKKQITHEQQQQQISAHYQAYAPPTGSYAPQPPQIPVPFAPQQQSAPQQQHYAAPQQYNASTDSYYYEQNEFPPPQRRQSFQAYQAPVQPDESYYQDEEPRKRRVDKDFIYKNFK